MDDRKNQTGSITLRKEGAHKSLRPGHSFRYL